MKVRVDRDSCIGVGNCVAYAPTVFKLDEENKAVVSTTRGLKWLRASPAQGHDCHNGELPAS